MVVVPVSWSDAGAQCKTASAAATLTVVSSAAENDAIVAMLKTVTTGSTGFRCPYYWPAIAAYSTGNAKYFIIFYEILCLCFRNFERIILA